ncbi:LytR family transcriptional regulator [Nocardioides humilatus]|uniref:LytR family transcriptional regulator n=1 Tax=Nocardioides humilatus TaxID=2607660 RepID=A0A5B1LM30_9ACTN|nr:LCP family protein [Nocardioides humilatus]KAA1420860.1 LytR family transcriptional regulator [Nocardioides humilatus]
MKTQQISRWNRALRTCALALVLGVAALVVPNGAVAPTYFTLVKYEHASGVDTDPDVIWILAVGSDARRGEDPLHSRGDTLQLVGMDTKTGAATSIGIPRDSWVPIAGYGSNRINSALFFGGPQLLGQTVADLIGIEPDYVFVTTFWGVEAIADDIGPITVNNPVAFADEYLKPKGFPKGKVVLRGYNVVAFGRIRHELIGGDFDRSANQQRVLKGFQRKVADNADNPGWIERGVLSVMDNVHTNLDPAELFEIAQAVAHVDPKKITGCVVPGGIGNIGGASVVLPSTSTAARYGDDARKDATIKNC